MIKITLLETNRVHIQIDEKTVQVGTDRVGYTVVQGTSTAKVQVDYGETYKSWNKSVIMTNAQGRSIRKPLDGMYATFEFDLPIEMTIAPYTKLLFQAVKGDQIQRWTIVDIPIARTAEGQMPPIPSTDAEEIRGIAENAEKIAKDALEEAARSGTSVLVGGVPQTSWDADTKLDKTEFNLQFNQLIKIEHLNNSANYSNGLVGTNHKNGSFTFSGKTNGQHLYVPIINYGPKTINGHKYYFSSNIVKNIESNFSPRVIFQMRDNDNDNRYTVTNNGIYTCQSDNIRLYQYYFDNNNPTVEINFTISPIMIDLTEMFGAGNEPKTVAEVQKYIPAGTYYPYQLPNTTLTNRIKKYIIDGNFNITINKGEYAIYTGYPEADSEASINNAIYLTRPRTINISVTNNTTYTALLSDETIFVNTNLNQTKATLDLKKHHGILLVFS